MTLIDKLSDRVAYLSASYEPNVKAAGVFRILYAAVVVLQPVNYLWVNDVPGEFLHQGPGLQLIYTDIPPVWVVTLLQVLQLVTALWLALGWRTMAASISLFVVALLGSALTFSFSKVDHTLLYQTVPVVMAAAGWGRAFSLDARRTSARATSGYPLVVFSMLITFSMATAAAAKAAAGWWDPGRYGARAYVATDYLTSDKPGVLAGFALHHVTPWMWKLIDWGTLFAEGWLIVAMFSPTLFRLGATLLPIFHLSVYLTLDIGFETFVFVYGAFFLVPPSRWYPLVNKGIARLRGGRDPVVAAVT
jgi:hypothetical protein